MLGRGDSGVMEPRLSRWLRGGGLGIASTLLGVAAHAAAGGLVPHPGVLLPLAVLTAAAGAGLARKRSRPVRVLGVLAASQLALHALYVSGHQTHPHAGSPAGSMTTTAGHVAAVVAVALMLVHAESLLAGMVGAVAAVLPVRWNQPAPVAGVGSCLPRWVGAELRQIVLLALIHPRRGPPRHS